MAPRLCFESLESRSVPAVLGLPTGPDNDGGGGPRRGRVDPCDVPVNDVGIVEALYRKILCREADPDGLAGYNARLAAGESVESVATEIWDSIEHRGRQVVDYFDVVFGEKPSAGEFPDQVERLFQIGEGDYLSELLGGAEFSSRNQTDADWLTAVYDLVLGRAPDQTVEGYLAEFSTGRTRIEVANEIVKSDEAELVSIRGLYPTILGRNPSANELADYSASLSDRHRPLRELAIEFLSSDEFFRLAT